MRFSRGATDRIAASAACSYGLFWVIALGSSIIVRASFQPNWMDFFAAGIAVIYVMFSVLSLFRIKGATRLLQITTIICTVLVLAAFCVLFVKEKHFQRVLLVAFAQLQLTYAVCICLLLGHDCQPAQEPGVEKSDNSA